MLTCGMQLVEVDVHNFYPSVVFTPVCNFEDRGHCAVKERAKFLSSTKQKEAIIVSQIWGFEE